MSGYIGTQPVPQATQHRETFTATAGQTSFATAGYTPQFLDVFLNGIHLLNPDDYTASNGSDVVLTTGAALDDVLEVISYSTYEVNSQNYTGGLTVDNSAATVLTVDRAGSDGSIIDVQKNGSTVGSIGSRAGLVSTIVLDPRTNGSGLTGSVSRLNPVDGSGDQIDGTIDLGEGVVRFRNLYLSGGVYLGGTGAANKLDDYEEGTWNPTVTSGGISSVNTATYVKIGKMVFFQTDMSLSGTRGSEEFFIGGLPFTCLSSGYTAVSGYHYQPVSSYQQVVPLVFSSTTNIGWNAMGSNIPANQFGNGYINVAGCYPTS